MGFFDKIKATLKQIKEDNKYMGLATARLNNKTAYFGNVIPRGEDTFRSGSYINLDPDKAVIYNTGIEGYYFTAADIANFNYVGTGKPIQQDKIAKGTLRFNIDFNDGKQAQIDVFAYKVDEFKAYFNL